MTGSMRGIGGAKVLVKPRSDAMRGRNVHTFWTRGSQQLHTDVLLSEGFLAIYTTTKAHSSPQTTTDTP